MGTKGIVSCSRGDHYFTTNEMYEMMKSKRLERVAKILTEDDSCAERMFSILYVYHVHGDKINMHIAIKKRTCMCQY